MQVKGVEDIKNYNELSYEELRELLLKGELEHQYMAEEDYSWLLDNEIGREDFNPAVTTFCLCDEGLGRFDEYKNYDDIHIDIDSIFAQAEREGVEAAHEEGKKFTVVKPKRLKRSVIIAAAVVSALLVAFSFTDFFRKFLNVPEKTPVGSDDNHIFRSDDTRFYNSMLEMLEAEKLNILYPAKLPNGYAFTNFEVNDFGVDFAILAYATEPYIEFKVLVDVGIHIDSYEYKVNGIGYNIFKMSENLYQADFSIGEDYYLVVVNDRAILSDIIKNLQGVPNNEN